MGGCVSSESGDDNVRSKKIDQAIKKERQDNEGAVKLLLLGAGESGKSTIFKQMKIIHKSGYDESERVSFRAVVYSNTIQAMKILLEAADHLGIPIDPAHKAIATRVEALPLNEVITTMLATDMTALWKSEAIQQTFARASEYQLPDSTPYYLNDLARLSDPNYLPTVDDILHTRVQTTGIVEMNWFINDVAFKMFDVGGQRNERRKWIHCFENVTAVIFVAALSCYDLVLFEDETQNRMHESLNLFDQICNSRWFNETAMILFLNKKDLFDIKIKVVGLSVCFPEYRDSPDAAAAAAFIEKQFKQLNKHPTRQVYVHFTCATSTDNIKFVFSAVKDIAMQSSLRDSGF